MKQKHPMKCIECGEWNASLATVRERDRDWERRYFVTCFNGHGLKPETFEFETEGEAWTAYFNKNMGVRKP